jgi:hypothetical protein
MGLCKWKSSGSSMLVPVCGSGSQQIRTRMWLCVHTRVSDVNWHEIARSLNCPSVINSCTFLPSYTKGTKNDLTLAVEEIKRWTRTMWQWRSLHQPVHCDIDVLQASETNRRAEIQHMEANYLFFVTEELVDDERDPIQLHVSRGCKISELMSLYAHRRLQSLMVSTCWLSSGKRIRSLHMQVCDRNCFLCGCKIW